MDLQDRFPVAVIDSGLELPGAGGDCKKSRFATEARRPQRVSSCGIRDGQFIVGLRSHGVQIFCLVRAGSTWKMGIFDQLLVGWEAWVESCRGFAH